MEWYPPKKALNEGFGYYINRDRLIVDTGVYVGPGNVMLHPLGQGTSYLFWVSCHHTPTVILVFHYYYHFTISFFYQDTKLKPTRAMRLCNNSIMTKWRGDTFLNNNSTKMQNTHVYAVMYNVSGTKWRVVDNTPTTYQPSVCIRRLLKEKSKWHLSF